MITGEMLKDAAAEAERFLLGQLPEEETSHSFSEKFERKMKRLMARAEHPVRFRAARCVAAVLLLTVMLSGSVLLLSPKVRASAMEWIRIRFSDVVQPSNGQTDENAQYKLTAIPEKYSLLQVIDKENGKTYIYADESGRLLMFAYSIGEGTDSIYFNTDGYMKTSGNVNGVPADIYLSLSRVDSSLIIWGDNETGALLRIMAFADAEELIDLAESVRKTE